MSALDFCYWLKGILDCHGTNEHMLVDKIQLINSKLNDVFHHIANLENNLINNQPINYGSLMKGKL